MLIYNGCKKALDIETKLTIGLYEARQMIQENPDLELNPVYLVMIQERESGFITAKESYAELISKYADNWNILMEVANRYAYNSAYEEAIELYETCFKIAPKPRYTDMLECIAYFHRHLGNNAAAIDAYERQLKLLKEEWDVTKGEVVKQIQENIELCKKR